MSKPHELDIDAIHKWLSEENWHTYAMSTVQNKRIQFSIGSEEIRVLHGKEIVYEGFSLTKAVDWYNSITTKPALHNEK